MNKWIDPIAEPVVNALKSGPNPRNKVPIEFEMDDETLEKLELIRLKKEKEWGRPVTSDEIIEDALKKQLLRKSSTEELFKKGDD